MKTSKFVMIAAVMALLFAGAFTAHADMMGGGNGHGNGMQWNTKPIQPGPGNTPGMAPPSSAAMVWLFPRQPVSGEERSGLVQMRQEMKLARDVSLALFNRWQQAAFMNSTNARQLQMEATKALVDKYGIADPVVDNTPGVFADPQYTELYQAMVSKGMVSLDEAMRVGAAMDERSVYILNQAMGLTDNDDMMAVYQDMMVGAQNHLRVFVGMMEGQGMFYNPQYISHNEMEEIMTVPWE